MNVVKSTKKRRRALLINIAIYSFLSAGAFTGAFLLYRSIHQVMIQDVPAIGALNFKLNSVERRFSGRMVWGNVTEESPVYSGDVLRTGNGSAVSAVLLTGDIINLGENTLIQIFYDELRGARLELQDGQLSLKTTGAPLTLKAGGKEFKAGAASAVTIRSGEKVELVTHEGSVDVEENGVTQTLAAGQSYFETESVRGDESGAGETPVTPPPRRALSVTQPLPGAEMTARPGGIPFSWNTATVGADEPVRIEASRDAQFRVIAAFNEVTGGTGTAALPLREGVWWWRIYRPQSEDGAASLSFGRLTVVPEQPRYDPAAAATLAPPVLLASVKPDEPVLIPQNTAEKLASINTPPSPPSQFNETPGADRKPEPVQKLSAPSKLWPPAGHVFTAAYLRGRQTLSFFCGSVEGASLYVWTFTQDRITVTRTTPEPACRFDAIAQLQNGRLNWQVEAAVRADGEIIRGEAAGSHIVLTIPPAPAPALNPPEKVTP